MEVNRALVPVRHGGAGRAAGREGEGAASPRVAGVLSTAGDGVRRRLRAPAGSHQLLSVLDSSMESTAGSSAAAEPAHPCAEPELPAAGPAELAGGGEAVEVSAATARSRCLRAVYVLNDPPKVGAGARSPEAGARQCLLRACEAEGAQLGTVNFGELDFGETAVLDAFYDAGEQVGLRRGCGRELRLGLARCQVLRLCGIRGREGLVKVVPGRSGKRGNGANMRLWLGS